MFDVPVVPDDLSGLSRDQLTELMADLSRLRDQADAARLRVLAEWDRQGAWRDDLSTSAVGWLLRSGRMSRGHAAREVSCARKLDSMPWLAAAVDNGDVSPAKARVITAAVTPRTAEEFARQEQSIVEAVLPLDVDQTQTLMHFWVQRADPDGPEPGDPTSNRASFHQAGGDGRGYIRADLDAESFAIVASGWEAIVEEMRRSLRGDPHAPGMSRIRADALVEIFRRAAGSTKAGRPLFWAVVPATPATPGQATPGVAEVLAAGGIASSANLSGATRPYGAPMEPELMGFGPINRTSIDRWLCDCDVATALVGAKGEVLNLGRAKRTASDAQRRALVLRDKGCRIPGCTRPPDWCEAHHIDWWEKGGTTDLVNLMLACSFHHHVIHRGRIVVTVDPDGELVFTYPGRDRIVA